MTRSLRFTMALLLLVAVQCEARAVDWMFQPSAYSYSPKWGVEVGPNRFGRGPYYTPQSGSFVRGGYRNTYGGPGYGRGGRGWGGGGDYSNLHESWIQYGEQYHY